MAEKRSLDYETPPKKKSALNFPWWAEGLLIVVMLVLAVIEWTHGQWVWATIFGVAGLLFGASLAARLMTGDRDGK
jgi:hypothetical protein